MTRLDALKALRDAVRGGADIYTLANYTLAKRVFPPDQAYVDALRAFEGSLDAAKALHEAVLPGWGWDVSNVGACEVICYRTDTKVEAVSFIDNPARAWLLAILEALISRE